MKCHHVIVSSCLCSPNVTNATSVPRTCLESPGIRCSACLHCPAQSYKLKVRKKTHKANIKKRIDWFHSVLIFSISSNSYYCGSEVDQRLEQQHTVGWIFTSEWIIVSAALVEWVGTWPCWGGGWVQLSKPACHQNKLTPAQNNTSDAKTAQSLWGTQEMVDWEQFCVFWRERKNSKWLGMTFFSSSAESWRSPQAWAKNTSVTPSRHFPEY